MLYSKSTGGFYDASIHGPRTLTIIQPGWSWPQIEVPNPQNDPESSQDGNTIIIDDPNVTPPTVEIDNPACLIPADAVEITDTEHAALMAGQAAGKQIVPDENGYPVLQDPPPPSSDQLRADAVRDIEATRDEALRAGVLLNGARYHTDETFLTELLGLLMGYNVGIYSGTQDIRTMDNTIVQLTVQDITSVAAAVGAHRKAVYAQSWAEKDAL